MLIGRWTRGRWTPGRSSWTLQAEPFLGDPGGNTRACCACSGPGPAAPALGPAAGVSLVQGLLRAARLPARGPAARLPARGPFQPPTSATASYPNRGGAWLRAVHVLSHLVQFKNPRLLSRLRALGRIKSSHHALLS